MDYSGYSELVERVKELDSDNEQYMAMLREPAFVQNDADTLRAEFTDWLLHIVSQEYDSAYRRNLHGWVKDYTMKLCATYGVDKPDPTVYPYSLVTEHFMEVNNIRRSDAFTLETVPARELITYNRFDLMAKWIYVASVDGQFDTELAKQVYRESIDAFSGGTFIEGDSDTKVSFEHYLEAFDDLISNIGTYGFDGGRSVIPVGANGEIFDGAHRTAVAAYYDMPVSVMRFKNRFPGSDYDYKYFRKRLMPDKSMAYMAKCYMEIKDTCKIVCLLPIKNLPSIDTFETDLFKYGHVVYMQPLYLTKTGFRRLCDLIGRDEKTPDVNYDHSRPMVVYIFEPVETKLPEQSDGVILVPESKCSCIIDLITDRSRGEELNYGYAGTCINRIRELLMVPKQYRTKVLERMYEYQVRHKMYSCATTDYGEYVRLKRLYRAKRIKEYLKRIARWLLGGI